MNSGVDSKRCSKSSMPQTYGSSRFHLIDKRLLSISGPGPVSSLSSNRAPCRVRGRPIPHDSSASGRSCRSPRRVMSFHWPRSMPVLLTSGVWQHLVDRVSALGRRHDRVLRAHDGGAMSLERNEVFGAIRGSRPLPDHLGASARMTRIIDLRSDTVSKPSEAMRQAMFPPKLATMLRRRPDSAALEARGCGAHGQGSSAFRPQRNDGELAGRDDPHPPRDEILSATSATFFNTNLAAPPASRMSSPPP